MASLARLDTRKASVGLAQLAFCSAPCSAVLAVCGNSAVGLTYQGTAGLVPYGSEVSFYGLRAELGSRARNVGCDQAHLESERFFGSRLTRTSLTAGGGIRVDIMAITSLCNCFRGQCP